MTTHLKRTLIRNMATCAVFVAAFLAVRALMPTMMVWDEHEQPANEQPSPVELLIEERDCWTGEAPADMQGEVPGHVIVTRDSAKGPEYLGANWVGRALDQIFADGKDVGTIHGFCR